MALIWSRRRTTEGTVEPPVHSALSDDLDGLTAASAPVPPEKWGRITRPQQQGRDGKWADECWEFLDIVGELSFALLWKTALISRFRLVASDIDPETGKPTGTTDNQAAIELVARIAGGATGQSQMLARLTPLLTIPGQGWLAIVYPDGVEEWHILSQEEVHTSGQAVEITRLDGTKYRMNPETDTLSRIWRPDPRRSSLPWSPVKAARPILRQIVRATQTIEAASKSRLAGNGVLILPSEVSMPTQPAPRGAPDPDAPNLPPPPPPTAKFVSASDIRKAIQEAMSKAIEDPSSAEALVPIVLMVAGEYVKHVQHLKFDTEIGERALEALEAAVRRLAMTLDMPAEVLLGQGDLNHWSLFGIEEQAVRWHASPEMEVVCDALTRELLRPMLGAKAGDTVIWYDTSDVDAEPDEFDKVDRAYTAGVANSRFFARKFGMSDEDGYDLSTREGWTLWATDQVRRKPELFAQLLPLLRVLVPSLAEVPDPAPAQVPATPAQPALEPAPGHSPPDTRDNAALTTAAAGPIIRMCVNQALRLAGGRRAGRADHSRLRNVHPTEFHLPQYLGPARPSEIARLIDGWADMVDDSVCASAGITADVLRDVVVTTCATALTTGRRPVMPWERP
ncbi:MULTISPECIES: hypothetical protein [Nocardia]|uniref:hypothetical protein n=1 Tax=Nocardia TaxID=1817 RepID=UPI0024567067|nr:MULTISPECIES: hypothetical protein [Nocardia]